MKKLILIFTMLYLTGFAQHKAAVKPAGYPICTIYGNSKKISDQKCDSLKNRDFSGIIDTTIKISNLLKPGKDQSRFSSSDYVRLKAIIVEAKWSGPEQCNCHSKYQEDLDIHIVISDSRGNGKIICEINRFSRKTNPELSMANIKSMVGKKVFIEGYLFPDTEHAHNATNSCGSCTDVWRTTIWEIHPVTKITLR